MEGEGQEAHHHPLVGLGRMAGEGERVGFVVMAIQVGNLEFGLEDGRLEGHGNPAKSMDYPDG